MDKGIELRIAIHEAGHAIVCIDQDKTFDSVDMIQKGFEFGHFKQSQLMNKEKDWREELMKNILICLGGHAADCIFFKKHPADLFKSSLNGSETDMKNVYTVGKELLKLSDDQIPMYVNDSMVRAMEIVNRRWSDLNKLAVALMRKKTLSYQDCKRLLN